MEAMEETEENGIKAVTYLQKMVGINETRESALDGWNNMNAYEKAHTLRVYSLLLSLYGEDPLTNALKKV